MLIETFSIGSIAPLFAALTQDNWQHNYPWLQPYINTISTHLTESKIVFCVIGTFLCLFSFKIAFILFMSSRQYQFIWNIYSSLSTSLFKNYLYKPWEFHLKNNSSTLILNTTKEIYIFTDVVLKSVLKFTTECVFLLGIFIFLIYLAPVLMCLTIGTFGASMWLFQRLIQTYLLKLGECRQYHERQLNQHLYYGLGGAKDIKIMGREDWVLRQYDIHSKAYGVTQQKQMSLNQTLPAWLEMISIISFAVLTITAVINDIVFSSLYPLLALFTVAGIRAIISAEQIMEAIQKFCFHLTTVDTIYNELQQNQKKMLGSHKNKHFPKLKKEITLENISYRYETNTPNIVHNINLSIERGMSIGIVGHSGSGKSTLIDIILGFLEPRQGCIKIDGIDIQENLRSWQSQIGYVPQFIFLSDDSIKQNIALGLDEKQINEQILQKAIKIAQLEEFIKSLPDGSNTIIGEMGVRISGGQRQRIGIARAIYHDPEILIFDEATSALDTATEKEVMRMINDLQGNKTILLIAHRLSTLDKCDRIYKLEHKTLTQLELHQEHALLL